MHLSTSRRHAIRNISLGLGASILSPSILKSMDQKKKLGVALVGLGNYSTRQLAPALQETELCYLAGIVTGTPEKAKTWSAQYNIKPNNIYNYQNFDQIKNNPEIDIIYVVLPNFMHAEYTIRAAQAGKHVICEKPFSMNVKEGEAMLKACKEANVKIGVGYRLYYEPHHLEARRLGMNNVYGRMILIESSFGFTRPDPSSWRLDKNIGGGGAIMDLGVYVIQGARRTIGEDPIAVMAQGFNFDKEHFKDIYESVLWQFEFPGGTVANCATSYSAYVDRLYATCEKGWFELSPSYNAMGLKGRTKDGDMTFKADKYQQIAQMDDFAKAILEDREPIASGEEGLKDIKLIHYILKSTENRKRIEIPDL